MKNLIFGILLLTGISISAQANLITNGDFETGDLTGWASFGDARVVDTGTSYGNVALLGYDAHVGISAIAQAFHIDPAAESILVEFDYLFAGIDHSRLNDVFLSGLVTLEGVSPLELNFELLVRDTSSSPYFGSIVHFSGIFDVGDVYDFDPNAILGFGLRERRDGRRIGYTDSIAAIDNVSVSTVPEPSTLALMGLSLLGLGFVRRRQAK